MFLTFDDPKRFDGKKTWWMSFPKIESRKMISQPFGESPIFSVGEKVVLCDRPERKRKILSVHWHRHRYQWVYVVETTCSDRGDNFKPYWFADKLIKAN